MRFGCGPDRIILGECRGAEAFDMLQAMNTGHDGSICTMHSNTPRDALTRIEKHGANGIVQFARDCHPPSDRRRAGLSRADRTYAGWIPARDCRDRSLWLEGDTVTMNDVIKFEYTVRVHLVQYWGSMSHQN